jgi:hypothetical protein
MDNAVEMPQAGRAFATQAGAGLHAMFQSALVSCWVSPPIATVTASAQATQILLGVFALQGGQVTIALPVPALPTNARMGVLV